ncbi:hypothetical protein DSO57_1016170 [Entomophthora muscae]|uniref:Uncharacterized protein n=1 Tax=Entomophthora muscae TaxID=34485 RepID=A0ACC2SU32_9FUNG|nr:hypothetical protein DSO57_1016170 [Entomophthora muscae]
MKSILALAAVYFASAEPARYVKQVCNANVKEITIIYSYALVEALNPDNSETSDKFLADCKKTTDAKVFYKVDAFRARQYRDYNGSLVFLNATVAKDIKNKYIPKYDGINFDISGFATSESVEVLLKDWDLEHQLSLTLDGAQWPKFEPVLNKNEALFSHLYFRFDNITEFESLFNERSCTGKPKPHVYLDFNKQINTTSLKAIQATHAWVKGAYYLTYSPHKDDIFLLVNKPSCDLP